MKNYGKTTNISLAHSRDESVNISFDQSAMEGYIMQQCIQCAVPVPSPVSSLRGGEPYDFEKIVLHSTQKLQLFDESEQSFGGDAFGLASTIQDTPCTASDEEMTEQPLKLPNFHEALLLNEQRSERVPQRSDLTVSVRTSGFAEQAQKLITLIGNAVGPGSSQDLPFAVDDLEKQAIKCLRYERQFHQGKSCTLQLKLVIAACCFLQYTQKNSDEIKISDVEKLCAKLRVKPEKAIEFIDRRQNLFKAEPPVPHEEQSDEEDSQNEDDLDCKEELEIVTESASVCQTQTNRSEQVQEMDSSYIKTWQEVNGQFLESTLRSIIDKSIGRIEILMKNGNQRAQKQFLDFYLKPPTKAEIKQLKEFRRKQNQMPSPGSIQWLARIQKQHQEEKENFMKRQLIAIQQGQDIKKITKPKITDCPPSLKELRDWFLKIKQAFLNFIANYNLLMACFWHSYKKQNLNNTSVAAIFYLITCQDLFEADDPEVNQLLKGIGENRFKLRRKALIELFGITEGMLHGALRKIKDSPPINRIKSKWGQRAGSETCRDALAKKVSTGFGQTRIQKVQPLLQRDASLVSKYNTPVQKSTV